MNFSEILKTKTMAVFRLTKPGIAFLASLTLVTGYALGAATNSYWSNLFFALLGVWLTASGSGALNQVQEYQLDALMQRTHNRPIPSGILSYRVAMAISLLLIICGLSILGLAIEVDCAALAAFAVFWYNGVYTYCKKYSRYAVFPGAVIGAIPPLIGWIAAGGGRFDQRILTLAIFIMVWQIPHFWLLQLRYVDDVGRNGLPHIFESLNDRQVSRITFVWILAVAVIGMMLPLFGVIRHALSLTMLFGCSSYLAIKAVRFLTTTSALVKRGAFSAINIFILLIQIVLVLDEGLRRM